MTHTVRPGDVLAGRYRLVDLLTESGGGRFWRAHDRVLQRHVALHVIPADDPRSEGLLEAARSNALLLDRRVLRVLDAETRDGLCYVVNEWGSGTSLDILVTSSGPLEPRRAAWLVSEVADSVAQAHEAGVAHGRLVPENVLVDRTGEIRVIGLGVDAAMHGLSGTGPSTDVTDLAGLLYCALTGKWAGASTSGVPRAPEEHGVVLRPRQVRAGIPRPLDALCDAVLQGDGQPGSRGRELVSVTTAREIQAYLSDFVGDPAGIAEGLLATLPRRRDLPLVLPSVPEIAVRDAGEQSAVREDDVADPVPATQPTVRTEVPAETTVTPELPTQAGMPIFDDESGDVSWLAARETPPPPPPPFDQPPERPLFAPSPPNGTPLRTPRPGGSATSNGAGDFWPWDNTGTETGRATGSGLVPVVDEEPPPGRSWLRLAAAIAVGLLLLVAIVVAYNLGRGKTVLGGEPLDSGSSSSSTPTPSPSATPLGGLVAEDLDPQGTPVPEENPEDAGLAVDGDPATSWPTSAYDQQLGPGGLKDGVGLVVDLGGEHSVSAVRLTLEGAPTGVELYLSDERPTDVEALRPVQGATLEGTGETITLDEPATGRFLVVWLTELPPDGSRFRGRVAEVEVLGE
ncbi:protein kinase family protein [Nocardioides sp. cx-169]|uniref:protein kinase family protein n=1 Tax=Nocardioides sp. cx-169 TaxID=2899080 RepID=UPI001E3C63FA|nr:protein kinase family protein [Nocardioides sp. cx-169]MCD4533133.1 protein kinase family protein [Nocardioides sp. cx-169]